MKCLQFIKPYVIAILLLHFISVGLAQKKSAVKKPMIVFVTGDHEYSGESTLLIVAKELMARKE
jgi:hypothetical protein